MYSDRMIYARFVGNTRSSFSHCEYAISESTKDATPTLPPLATYPGSPNELWDPRGGRVAPHLSKDNVLEWYEIKK